MDSMWTGRGSHPLAMPSYSPPSLPKGQACLDCRRRKIRCDSVRPICGPCGRAERYEDCEYENSGISHVQQLEESILKIHSRIMELENPGIRPPTMLKNPYTRAQRNSEIGTRQTYPRSQNQSSSRNTHHDFAVQTLRLALDTLAPYVREIGFFLNPKRFRNACLRMGGTAEEPPAALLSSTEVLLCQYFLHKGRLLEAQYHLSVAVSYIVLGDLSNIRARGHRAPLNHPPYLPKTTLRRENPSSPSGRVKGPCQVDTPWPLEMEEYERAPQPALTLNTVQRFIDDVGDNGGVSYLAFQAKSAILLDRATIVARQWRPNMTPTETTAFLKPFMKLNKRIEKFRDGLPPPNSITGCTSAAKPRIILAHTIAHAATIQLNRTFIAVNPRCRELCLTACWSIVWIIRTASLRDVAT
ncbi:hypothetical protein B0H13DRAFT_2514705 [Mycena leptocephala]|nr:hypothetical protein B0H13DRAFT_2514705 [Mycena leptocephala]